MIRALQRGEEAVAVSALAAMVLLPLVDGLLRAFGGGGAVPAAGALVGHLTLWVGWLGAALAAREGKLLGLSTGGFLGEGRWRDIGQVLAGTVAAGVAGLLCRSGITLLLVEREAGTRITEGLPTWVAQAVLPIGFALIAGRLVWGAGRGSLPRVIAGIGCASGALLAEFPQWLEGRPLWPAWILISMGTLAGAPLFAALGGVAALAFMRDGVPAVAVLVETYRLTVSPTLAAIPLFTLTGFLLAEGAAPSRLLRLFQACFGFMPGGTAVVALLLCAFFTIPTGGSGVTILALGGLLLRALTADGYRERFSLGLLTGSGSLGLLLPPALPLILYGIVAGVPIEDMFLGGLVPGCLLITLMAGWSLREGIRFRVPRRRFDPREALAAVAGAKWELLLPVVVVGAIASGVATLVEASALTACYAFVVQALIHDDIPLGPPLFEVLRKCLVLIGGVLLILGVAMGLTSYLVDAQIPVHAVEWTRAHVDSPLVFLLMLNLFLLFVGALMDIFSATVVVAPLVVPLGAAFGIDPVHLGIIFLANLELGYLTPPVGLNLFLASYRFERPMLQVFRAVLPALGIQAVGVLLITYVPALTTGLARLLGR